MKNLLNLIPNAKDVKSEMSQNDVYIMEIKKNIERLNKRIQQAKSNNQSHVCFNVDAKYENDIKELYTKKGYSFKPTGVIGGVWQLTEEICW